MPPKFQVSEDRILQHAVTLVRQHGMAAMLATNHCSFSEENIQEIIGNVYDGLLLKLAHGRRHEENDEKNDEDNGTR